MDYAVLTGHLDELLCLIDESTVADDYRRAALALRGDAEAKRLMHRFIEIKSRYEEAARYGRYHPDYARLRREAYIAKMRLETHPTVADFRRAESALESLLEEIARIIAARVSPSVLVATRDPFYLRPGGAETAGAGVASSCASDGCRCGTR
ncbi:MAG: YlbF family regulator [Hydrogenibacillus sp.]|nr:YlbF family regulator [Hydrogenibacillus sp.]